MEFPRTVDRCTVQFSPQQRLAMYDYIVNAAKCVEKPKDVTLEDLMVDFEKKEGDGMYLLYIFISKVDSCLSD